MYNRRVFSVSPQSNGLAVEAAGSNQTRDDSHDTHESDRDTAGR
jgi:hypothetical protein